MTAPTGATQGFIAVSCSASTGAVPDLHAALAAVGVDAPTYVEHGTVRTATWGLDAPGLGRAHPLLLCRGARRREHELTLDEVRRLLAGPENDGLAEVLPTFAAVDHVDETTIVAAADVLGFRHLYYGTGHGFAVLSTSGRAVGACLGKGLDREAIAVQSLLGWQVGQRTLFQGVHKLAPGDIATLGEGHVNLRSFRPPFDGAKRVRRVRARRGTGAARVCRRLPRRPPRCDPAAHWGSGFATPAERHSADEKTGAPHRDPRASRQPGRRDRGRLSRRYGLAHEVLTLDGIDTLGPEEADRRCVEAARRLECMADPLAQAALTFAEARA